MPIDQIVDGPAARHHRPSGLEDLAPFAPLPPLATSPTPADVAVTPRWARLSLVVLLVSTAGAHLYNLAASTIASWVAAHFTSVTIGGQTVYSLTQRPSS